MVVDIGQVFDVDSNIDRCQRVVGQRVSEEKLLMVLFFQEKEEYRISDQRIGAFDNCLIIP